MTSPPSPSQPGAALPVATPSATLVATAWSSDTVAWAVSSGDGQILKSVDAGVTWKEVSRRVDGTCKLPARVTDVATVPGSADDAFFVEDRFARVWRTADGLVTVAPPAAGVTHVNCFDAQMPLAFDANRLSLAGACVGSPLHWGASFDGGVSGDFLGSPSSGPLRDTAARGGTMLAVGGKGNGVIAKRSKSGKVQLVVRGRIKLPAGIKCSGHGPDDGEEDDVAADGPDRPGRHELRLRQDDLLAYAQGRRGDQVACNRALRGQHSVEASLPEHDGACEALTRTGD